MTDDGALGRGETFLSDPSHHRLVPCYGPQADSGSTSAEAVGFPTADPGSAGSQGEGKGRGGGTFHYLTCQDALETATTEHLLLSVLGKEVACDQLYIG